MRTKLDPFGLGEILFVRPIVLSLVLALCSQHIDGGRSVAEMETGPSGLALVLFIRAGR